MSLMRRLRALQGDLNLRRSFFNRRTHRSWAIHGAQLPRECNFRANQLLHRHNRSFGFAYCGQPVAADLQQSFRSAKGLRIAAFQSKEEILRQFHAGHDRYFPCTPRMAR